MESPGCCPLSDYGGFETAAKDLSKGATEERSNQQQAADSSASSVQVPEQGEWSTPVDSAFREFDDYDFMPMDTYYPFPPDESLSYEAQQLAYYPGGPAITKTYKNHPLNPDFSEYAFKNFEKPEECFSVSAATTKSNIETPQECFSTGVAPADLNFEKPKDPTTFNSEKPEECFSVDASPAVFNIEKPVESFSIGCPPIKSTLVKPQECFSTGVAPVDLSFEKPKECFSEGIVPTKFNSAKPEECFSVDATPAVFNTEKPVESFSIGFPSIKSILEKPEKCFSTSFPPADPYSEKPNFWINLASSKFDLQERFRSDSIDTETPRQDASPVEDLKVKLPLFESFLGKKSVEQKEDPIPVSQEPVKEDGLVAESSANCVKEENEDVLSDDDLLTTGEENAPQTGAPAEPLSGDELAKIWELATKLCEARSTYNAMACRRKDQVVRRNQRKRPTPKPQVRAVPVAPDPMTNNGVCMIGKGSDWEDPPDWDWGQPLPEEMRKVIAEVLPTKPPAGAPTVAASDLDCAAASTSTCFSGAPVATQSQATKSSEPITLDSDDELPDVSVELGLPKNVEPVVCEVLDTSCTVIAVERSKLLPEARMLKKRRLIRSSRRKIVCSEVITLGSSDDSDAEIEVVSASKKWTTIEVPRANPAPAPPPPPPPPPPEHGAKEEWSCPICFETKDKVASTMSTICGHIFCGPCLQSTVKINKRCPTCRKKLTLRQIHNLYM